MRRCRCHSAHPFFGLTPDLKEQVLLEPYFLLGYYFGLNDWESYLRTPVVIRNWLLKRIQKELDSSKEKGNAIPSKGSHHQQNPSARALTGMNRTNVPAKLKRFT